MSLQLAVEMNESAKRMADTAREVHLQALDALVKSANNQDLQLAGFREVSSQMRRWSDDLRAMLERLRTTCATFVTTESTWRTLERRRRLLEAAGVQQTRVPSFATVLRRGQQARRQQFDGALAVLAELRQLGLMATVLSRTARIEATGAKGELLPALQEAASEFGARASAIIEEARRLARSASTP